jgi:hypothetical protein
MEASDDNSDIRGASADAAPTICWTVRRRLDGRGCGRPCTRVDLVRPPFVFVRAGSAILLGR